MIKIYHNPRCSKSRETLSLVEKIAATKQLELDIIDYQKTPLTVELLKSLLRELGGNVQTMLRSNEEEYDAGQLADADDHQAILAIANHPTLLQRPIVSYQGKAAIGRPPEQVLALFNESNESNESNKYE